MKEKFLACVVLHGYINTMEANKNSNFSNILKFALAVLLLFSFVVCSVVGVLGVRYFQSTKKSADTVTQAPKVTNFTSDSVFNPTGTTVDLVKKVAPSVTTVVVKVPLGQSPFTNEDQFQEGVGTGFFVSSDGLLVTNEHVVCNSPDPSTVSIVTSENKTYSVSAIATDPSQDIAILKVNLKGESVSALKFANVSSPIQPGMDVIAIGNPLGVNPGSVTRGIISGLGRNISAQGTCQNKSVEKDYEGVLQTDAAINSGNSGGPLINLNGEVIGVNSATSTGANNVSYAVPYERVVKLLERYQKNNGSIKLPFLGINYRMIDTNLAASRGVPEGAYIVQVSENGPAQKAGIKRGDIITKLGDKTIAFSLQATLSQYFEPGQEINVEVYRPTTTSLFNDDVAIDGKTITVKLTVGERN